MKKKVVDIDQQRKFSLHNDLDKIRLEIEMCDADAASPFLALEDAGIFKMAAQLPPGATPEITKQMCDYFDALSEYDQGTLKKQIEAQREVDADTNSDDPRSLKSPTAKAAARKKNKTGKSRQRDATVPEYYALFASVLGELRRDIFSGDLLCYDEQEKYWTPAHNLLGVLKSHAAELSQTAGVTYKKTDCEDHLDRLSRDSEARLVADVPAWDKVDRVGEMARCLKLRTGDGYPITSVEAEELIKQWWALAWTRLHSPATRNTILVLKGAQHIGKDWWIDTITGGLGQWALNLTISRDKDAELQLHDGMILKIAEFDRTASWEAGKLKDLITKPTTHVRAAYDRRAKGRVCRCSFISSCNVDDILRDHTGASRFTILEVEAIEYSYGRTAEDMAQLCAQGQALASAGYRATPRALKAMAAYLEPRIPEDPKEIVSEIWEHTATQWLDKLKSESFNRYADIKALGWVPNSDAADLLTTVARGSGFSIHQVRRLLASAGYSVKSDGRRGYRIGKSHKFGETEDADVLF